LPVEVSVEQASEKYSWACQLAVQPAVHSALQLAAAQSSFCGRQHGVAQAKS